MAVEDLDNTLLHMQSSIQNDLRMKRHRFDTVARKLRELTVERDRVSDEIVQLEKKQSELPILRATLLSRRTVYTKLDGEPVLLWVDRTATIVQGPAFTVFPTPEVAAPLDFEDDEDDDDGE